MLVSEIKEEDLTADVIDRLLFQGLEDIGGKADCLIVLGSIKAAKYRVPVAVDAYKAGRANKIMLCGGALRDFPDGTCSESQHMRKTALDLGVAAEDMLVFMVGIGGGVENVAEQLFTKFLQQKVLRLKMGVEGGSADVCPGDDV